ncbi:MAG: hypothetical protein AB7U83_02280 [Vicinamibacterales bacterium]
MTRVGGALVAAALVVGAVAPGAAAAQPPPAAIDGAELRPAEIQRLFDAYLVMEAQQTLGLTDEQYAPFLTRLRTLQAVRRRHQQARTQLLAELGRLSAPRAAGDDTVIQERLAALQELESRGAAEGRKAADDLDALLSPRQRARFRVFEAQIERRKIELMLRARQNARPSPRPGRLPRRQ